MKSSNPTFLAALIARGVRIGFRFFRGNFGRLPDRGRQPPESFRQAFGNIFLTGLQWPGPEPRLLMLNGLNSNAWLWARVATQLCARQGVMAVNLRGHGGSSAPAHGYALTDTAADLRGLLSTLGNQPIDLAGHSWGGKVAMQLAAEEPRSVRSLILADPVPPWGFNRILQTFPNLVDAAMLPTRRHYINRQTFEVGRRRMAFLRTADEIDRNFWQHLYAEQPDGSFAPRLPETAYREIVRRAIPEDIRPLMTRIGCPILLLLPTFTVSFGLGEQRKWQALFPQIQMRRISGDHAFIHTNSIDTAHAVTAFLKGLPSV